MGTPPIERTSQATRLTGGRGSWEHEVDERTLAWLDVHAADIGSVIMRTERDDEGITYEVSVVRTDVDSFEHGDNERGIWSRTVLFGNHDADRAGGLFFRIAAQDQDDCACVIWRRKRDAS